MLRKSKMLTAVFCRRDKSRRTSPTRRRGLFPRIARDERASVAVEFGLIAPLLVFLTMAIFEFVLVMYDYQAATDAARLGARTALLNQSLYSLDTLTSTTSITCTKPAAGTKMSCNGTGVTKADPNTAFSDIVAAAQIAMPQLTFANVTVTYSYTTVDDSQPATTVITTPMVTVTLTNLTHDILFLDGFAGLPTDLPMPQFASSRLAHSQL